MTPTPRTPELLGRAASSLGAALVALLLPKCPVCVAALLAALGLGAGASQSAAPFVRPLACILAGLAALALALALWRRRRSAASPCCGRVATPFVQPRG